MKEMIGKKRNEWGKKSGRNVKNYLERKVRKIKGTYAIGSKERELELKQRIMYHNSKSTVCNHIY